MVSVARLRTSTRNAARETMSPSPTWYSSSEERSGIPRAIDEVLARVSVELLRDDVWPRFVHQTT